MSREDTQPIHSETSDTEVIGPRKTQPVSTTTTSTETTPVIIGHQPYVDWDLLRESQAISRRLDRKPEPVYRIVDPFRRTS